MCSRLVWISLGAPRSDTLHTLPATFFLATHQVARCTASRWKLPHGLDGLRHPCPAHRPAVV